MTKTFNLRSLFKTVICLAFIFGCTTSAVFACSCLPPSKSFLERFSSANLIIIGKPTNHQGVGGPPSTPLTVDIEVQRVLKGNTDLQKVQILGGNGALCGVDVTRFPLNTIWIFALGLPTTGINGVPQYRISLCEAHSLQVRAGKVFGPIKSDQQTSMPLVKFLKSLRR